MGVRGFEMENPSLLEDFHIRLLGTFFGYDVLLFNNVRTEASFANLEWLSNSCWCDGNWKHLVNRS